VRKDWQSESLRHWSSLELDLLDLLGSVCILAPLARSFGDDASLILLGGVEIATTTGSAPPLSHRVPWLLISTTDTSDTLLVDDVNREETSPTESSVAGHQLPASQVGRLGV